MGRGSRAPSPWRWRNDPKPGASLVAPTAPHATPPAEAPAKASGPERFWDRRRVRMVLLATMLFSLAVHWVLAPWRLLPDRSGLEFKDVEGDLTIPVDLLGEEPVEAPPPPEKQAPPPTQEDPNAAGAKKDAGPRAIRDAAVADATVFERDAGAVALTDLDGGDGPGVDGGSVADADVMADGGDEAGALVASADAGSSSGGSGPRDPGSMIGLGGIVSAGQVNVTLLVNVAVIREHPVGARLGPLLWGIPQWNDFMKGSQTIVDPIRDTDWILIYGPSLIHTERDAVIVHYSASDAIVDKAVEAIAKRYDKGGPFDAGVPGVKASLGHADNGQRVFLRAQPHVLVVVPPDKANEFARVLQKAPVKPRVRPGEALRLTVKDPWKQVAIPGLKLPNSLKELRLWIIPRADGGADVFVEGDCTDAAAAVDVADALTDLLKRQNAVGVRIVTRGLLNNAKVDAEGDKIKMKLPASPEQLEALLQLTAGALGVSVPPPK